MNIHIYMKELRTLFDIKSICLANISKCVAILRPLGVGLLSASLLLTACQPSGTSNNYYNQNGGTGPQGGPQSPLSGGGGSGGGQGGSTGDGGGGQGVRCAETGKSQTQNRLFVRDIFEAIENGHLTMKEIPKGSSQDEVSEEALKVLVNSVKHYFGPASRNLEFTKVEFWKEFIKKISFLEDDRVLLPSQDANSPIALSDSCKIVQIAYWEEASGSADDGTLYISQKLWRELDQLNKIGLLAHEYFFKQARKAHYSNSDTVRPKIGKLLSTEGLTPLFTAWTSSTDSRVANDLPTSAKGFKYCEGSTKEDPTAKLQFYQYEGSDKRQHFVFPVISSTAISSSLLMGTNFVFDHERESEKDFAAGLDLLLYLTWKGKLNRFDLNGPFGAGAVGEEKFNDQMWTWFDRQFSESGLLSYDFRAGHILGSFDQLLENLSKSQKKTLWASYLRSSPAPISISFLNPTSNWIAPKDFKLKSKEDLISAVQGEIYNQVSNCKVPEAQRKSLIPRLMSEINTLIHQGEYPARLPEWTKTLKEIDATYPNDTDPKNENAPCTVSQNKRVTKELPLLLFKILNGSYGRQDVEDVLYDDSFTQKNEVLYGQVLVASRNESLTFDLSCRDYLETFDDITKRSTEDYYGADFVYDKKVTNKFTRYKDEKATPETIEAFQKLASFLVWQQNLRNPEEYSKYVMGISGKCEMIMSLFELDCNIFEAFMRDFKTESAITVEGCEKNIVPDLDDETKPSQCAIIRMETKKETYKVNFNLLPNSAPDIEFIRRIPNK